MFVSRVLSRASRSFCQSYTVLSASQSPQDLPTLSNCLRSLQSTNKLIPVPVNLLHLTINSSSTLRSLFFSSTSSKPDEEEHGNNGTVRSAEAKASEEAKADRAESSVQAKTAEQTKESGLGSEVDLSRDELVKLVIEKNFAKGLLDVADNLGKTSSVGKDKLSKIDVSKESNGAVPLLKTLLEGVEMIEKQIVEVVKKFGVEEFGSKHETCDPDRHGAILKFQNFAKSLLDVAGDLGRASSVVKDKFSKIDAFKESDGAAPLLKTLLEGVEMIEKQLAEVFRKFGVEKFDSKHEPYDPDRHDAILQFQVSSQPPGTIVAVLKAGYVLYDHVIRRAEVAITRAVEDSATDKDSESQR